ELFGKLQNVEIGDVIIIKTHEGKTYSYKVGKKFAVTPDHIEVVKDTPEEVLTLFTCTGFADSKRLIIQAYPIIKS
ncbi:MAG: sortase, partial [Candidatus Roizmanbacteria bacterium]